jgi:hypothetical protein
VTLTEFAVRIRSTSPKCTTLHLQLEVSMNRKTAVTRLLAFAGFALVPFCYRL